MENINERLYKVMEKENITQAELAKRLRVSQAYISKLFKEDSDKTPSERLIKIICDELNVNEHWLQTGEGNMRNETLNEAIDSLAAQYGLNELEKTLIMEYGKLKKEHKEVFRAFFDNVVNSMSETASTKESLTAEEMSQALKVLGTNNKKLI